MYSSYDANNACRAARACVKTFASQIVLSGLEKAKNLKAIEAPTSMARNGTEFASPCTDN